MGLKHTITIVKFIETSAYDEEWEVIYTIHEDSTHVSIWCDDKSFYEFDDIPSRAELKAKHPNKSQALEIIRLAKKEKKSDSK